MILYNKLMTEYRGVLVGTLPADGLDHISGVLCTIERGEIPTEGKMGV